MNNNPKPRIKAPISKNFQHTKNLIQKSVLKTVCEEAACPNITECFEKNHAAFMILGNKCTRNCAFCNVENGRPQDLDLYEPNKIAQAVYELNLTHVVITSVTRDDLPDGGAKHFANTINAIRSASKATIEVLVPDFRRKESALETIISAKPDVFNHNIETIQRLYPLVRKGASYKHSLNLLKQAKQMNKNIFTKSGLMLGLGENLSEVLEVMNDLKKQDVDFLTIGQYLRPSEKHHPVIEFFSNDTFKELEKKAYELGFLLASSSPLTRSSYHADLDFINLQIARSILNPF